MQLKRILVSLLVAIMMLSLAVVAVSAETGKEGQWTVAKRQESAGTYSM